MNKIIIYGLILLFLKILSAYQWTIGSKGLIFQPYASGVMDPYWDSYAKGVMIGLNLSHNPFHLYRSIIEGLTLDSVLRTENIEQETNIKIK